MKKNEKEEGGEVSWTHLHCQRSISIIDVATDACQPQVTAIAELSGGVHLEHLAHVHHLGLPLFTRQVHCCACLGGEKKLVTVRILWSEHDIMNPQSAFLTTMPLYSPFH